MTSPPLLNPAEVTLLMVDQQAGLAFGVGSIDRQLLVNNVIALAKTAKTFQIPVVVSTSASKAYSGPLMPSIRSVLGDVPSLERRNMNAWEDRPFAMKS
ncbi:hypothetical protein ACK9YZ_30415 [Rhizobium sp. ZK1]|uniref:hypothetical protein n=1 Tax=Rhizobium sp. ZK1 TaxID=3389872 RepID=UPI0039F6C5F0